MTGEKGSAPRRPVCAHHLDRDAAVECRWCSKPICDECTHPTDDGPVCTRCLDRIRVGPPRAPAPRSRRVPTSLYWGLGLPLAAAAAYALWRWLGERG